MIDSVDKGEINRYISKPWNDDELISYIRQAVEQHQLKKENQKLNQQVIKQNKRLYEFGIIMDKKVKETTSELKEKNRELDEINSKLEFNLFNTVRAFAAITDLANPEMKGHGQRVGVLARRIAEALNLKGKDLVYVEIAGLLHDIGKTYSVTNPDSTGAPSVQDEQIKKHPINGQRVVSFIDQLDDVGLIIKHHHEHYDGTGYPDRLRETEIPLGARIVAVADIYDRISNIPRDKNPYLKDMFKESTFSVDRVEGTDIQEQAAIHYIKKRSFSLYDPDAVKAFLTTVKEKGIRSVNEIKVPVKDLKEGMLLARSLFTNTGRFLLPYKTNLNRQMIEKIWDCSKQEEISEEIHHKDINL